MNNITCPSCGGQKATKINDHEYCCEYCSHTFRPIYSRQQLPQQINSQTQISPIKDFQSLFDAQNGIGKNRVTAAILGIVLGGFGVHQFYLGNTGRGILYLVMCWTYIPALLGLIEGIMLITQSDEEFAVKPKLIF